MVRSVPAVPVRRSLVVRHDTPRGRIDLRPYDIIYIYIHQEAMFDLCCDRTDHICVSWSKTIQNIIEVIGRQTAQEINTAANRSPPVVSLNMDPTTACSTATPGGCFGAHRYPGKHLSKALDDLA